jgi:hypothetical protein
MHRRVRVYNGFGRVSRSMSRVGAVRAVPTDWPRAPEWTAGIDAMSVDYAYTPADAGDSAIEASPCAGCRATNLC